MPKNPITDPTTYQEMTFARLVLSGTMTDRQAAEAAGLNPDSDAYTKSSLESGRTCLSIVLPLSSNLSTRTSTNSIGSNRPATGSWPASVPRVPRADFVPDTRVPFSIKRNPFAPLR